MMNTMKKAVAGLLLGVILPIGGVLSLPMQAHAAEAQTDYSAVFDATYYAALYPDLFQRYGTNEKALLTHFIQSGMAEGRQASAEFNVLAYAARYPDLQKAFGTDLIWYYYHYINFGKKEGRIATLSGLAAPVTTDTKAAEATVPAQTEAPGRQSARALSLIASDASYVQAAAVLDAVGWDLQAAYNWSSTAMPYYGHGKPDMPETGAPGTKWFATFGFTNLKGNCYVMAATFCEMARLVGYDARQMDGYVRNVRGGLSPHSWVEIDFDGQTYVFDPDYTYSRKKSAFKVQYGQKGTWQYQKYHEMTD